MQESRARGMGQFCSLLGHGSVLAGSRAGLNYREGCGILQGSRVCPRMWGDGAGLELLVPSTMSRLVLLPVFGDDCQYLYLDFSGCQTNCKGLEDLSSDDWSGCLSLEAMESSTLQSCLNLLVDKLKGCFDPSGYFFFFFNISFTFLLPAL